MQSINQNKSFSGKYRYLLFCVFVTLSFTIVKAQVTPSSSQNFIYSRVIVKEGVKTATDLAALPVDSMRAEIQYFDGLGRSIQSIAVRNSPTKKDIITPIVYDAFGRQDKNYLAYEHNSQTGAYQPTAVTAQGSFYSTAGAGSIPQILNPFGQTIFEASPLNRPLESAAPGASWKVGNGHTIRTGYEINVASEVRLWNITITGGVNTGASSPGYYGAGQLYKNVIWDENRNRVIEYKDKEGQVVCKKVQDGGDTLNSPTFMITQYIYDDFNQLAYVIPPSLEAITSFTETDANFSNYIYAYHYDGRRRLIEKKIPGKGWEYTVYNKGDKPIFSQDSMQRVRGVWAFMKYDTLGRPVITGETANASTRSSLETLAGTQSKLYEIRDNTKSWGYTNTALPTTLTKIFTLTYYDEYTFLQSTVNPNPIPTLFTQPAGTAIESNRTKSLPTISVTNVLDSAKYLYSIIYYDEKGRVTKTASQHLLNGADITTNTLNFVGEVTTTTRKHYKDNFTTPALTVTTTNQYDHAGRMTRSIEKINTQVPDTITYAYNQVGQLSEKKIGNQTIATFYNERGWVKKLSAPLFTEELKYDSAAAANKQYNGNIGQQLWKGGSGTQTQRTYSYLYDRANRLTAGTSDEGYNESGITYDKMGNIKTLTRPKRSATAITYNYGTKGNQLQSVSGGYARGYTYNGNGSVATMTGTNPLTITYNVLNLPKGTTGSTVVNYVYDAAGSKLKKSTAAETRWYIDGIEYITNSTTPSPAIDLLHTAAGVARRSGTTYNYEYFLTDHLGNNRIVFNKLGSVLQQTDYYPFGMSIGRVANTPNRYLYNGKEQQTELGGTEDGQYDYGARFYDPAIGRWHVVDPKAQLLEMSSPYVYALNSPSSFIDMDGELPIYIGGKTSDDRERNSKTYWDAQLLATIAGSGIPNPGHTRLFVDGNRYLYNYGSTREVRRAGLAKGQTAEARRQAGYEIGKRDFRKVLSQLERDPKTGKITEKIQIYTHSRGAAFGAGYTEALLEMIKQNSDEFADAVNEIDYVLNMAPHQSDAVDAPAGIKSFSIDHTWDMLSGDDMGNNIGFKTNTKAGSPGVSHQNKTFTTEVGAFIEAYQKSKGDDKKLINDFINLMRSYNIKVTVN